MNDQGNRYTNLGVNSGTAWFSQFNRPPARCSEWYSRLETYPRRLISTRVVAVGNWMRDCANGEVNDE